ncbi:MAG: HEAT repeat domain-containing protein [Candidatus Aminicenantes bacterium]|jgi:hypothetical protein
MDEKEVQQQIEKIEKLIKSPDKLNEMSFRMVLEGLISKVGEEAELIIAHYINNNLLDLTTRLNIVRLVGYIQSSHFLAPLKKIIEKDENIHLRKEAIISVSKYNDRMALDILNQALVNIKNPLLLETINNEVTKIKRNNPVFALLPRFLEGEKNLKEFHITIGILKRILTPADAPMFVAYLNCGRRIIEDAAFEILCFTADERLQEHILPFFQDRFNEFSQGFLFQEKQPEEPGEKKKKNESEIANDKEQLYLLVSKVKYYFLRNPSLIDQHLENLGTQLLYIKESRIRGLFINIISQSQQPEAISFMGDLYEKVPELQEAIIRGYYGNESAMDLLFEKYQNAQGDLKALLIRSLLNCRKGLEYFYLHFSSLGVKEKEIIVNHLPYGENHDLSNFFKLVFQSNRLELKALLLNKAKKHYEFSIKDILFDPAWQKEFSIMEEDYLDTVTQLFPIRSVKMLMETIANTNLFVSKGRTYLKKIKHVVAPGFAFTIRDRGFITRLFNQVIQFNDPDIGSLFLSILKDIKTFDLQTYYNFHESLGLFTSPQGRKINPKEVEELRKARKNLNDLYYEIQRLEEGLKLLERVFARQELDFEQITDFLTRHPLCAALHLQRLTQRVSSRLQAAKPRALRQWIQLFYQFPLVAVLVKDAILEKVHFQKSPLSPTLTKLHRSLPQEPHKVIIHLSNRSFTAGLKEQCHDLIPMIPISTEGARWQEGDLLLCDPDTLKEFILKNTLPSKKLFLLLEKQSDFSTYKSYNARALLKPLSVYRVFKEILNEMFI